MMYSAEYEITLSNLVKLFTSVKHSIVCHRITVPGNLIILSAGKLRSNAFP